MAEPFTMTPHQEQNSWQYKAIVCTRGNQTLLGTILLALLARPAKNPPQITGTATIDPEGLVWTVINTKSGERGVLGCVGHIVAIRDEFRRLADHMRMDDLERIELFEELKKWVAIDMRADHDELKNVKLN